jgi:hypothetical protein
MGSGRNKRNSELKLGMSTSTQLEMYLLGFVESYRAVNKGCDCCNYYFGTHVFIILYLNNTSNLTLEIFMAEYIPYFANSFEEKLEPKS